MRQFDRENMLPERRDGGRFAHMRVASLSEGGLSDTAYIELVRSLFTSLAPTAIMGSLFILVASLAMRDRPDPLLTVLGLLGGAASLIRVAITLAYERRARTDTFDFSTARKAERLFGVSYLGFATVLGFFSARAFMICESHVQTVVAALVVGYAAGVAAGVSLRPRISIPAVIIAVVPTAAAALAFGDMTRALLALVLLSLLAGGIGSMFARYRSEVEKIALRHLLASLAQRDHLTGLANRLALERAFEAVVAKHGLERVALHCLDLDRFKLVNDQFGHPAGDALLIQAADRIRAICREGDVVARLGGDEFVVLQTDVGHPDEAQLMSRRIVRALSAVYQIDDQEMSVGASLGYVMSKDCGWELSQLLGCADSALYRVKREGGGVAAYA